MLEHMNKIQGNFVRGFGKAIRYVAQKRKHTVADQGLPSVEAPLKVAAEIERFFVYDKPEAICVTGEWGVGKTYTLDKLYKNALQTGLLCRKRYAYVSLFGIGSLEALKISLYENSKILVDPNSNDPDTQKAKEFASAAISLAKKSNFTYAAIPVVGRFLGKDNPLFFGTFEDHIVCFDDLERRGVGLGISDVLGLVSLLKEERNCKVILLLNDHELGKDREAFATNFEKVFDGLIRFAPTPTECANIAVPESDEISIRIREDSEKLKIANIRVIKKIERFAKLLEPSLSDKSPAVIDRAIHSLALFSWIRYQPNLAPSLQFVRDARTKTYFSGVGLADAKQPTKEEQEWTDLLQDYGFDEIDSLDEVIIEGIENGYFDSAAVESAAAELEIKMRENSQVNLLSLAWEKVRLSFADNEEEIVDLAKRAISEVLSPPPHQLSSVLYLLKELGRDNEAKRILSEFAKRDMPDPEYWNLSRLPFGGKQDISQEEIFEVFSQKYASVRKRPDVKSTLLNLYESNGWSGETVAFLNTVSVDEFKNLFLTTSGTDLYRIIAGGLKFANIVNADTDLTTITANVEEALSQISNTSKLHAVRVKALKR